MTVSLDDMMAGLDPARRRKIEELIVGSRVLARVPHHGGIPWATTAVKRQATTRLIRRA